MTNVIFSVSSQREAILRAEENERGAGGGGALSPPPGRGEKVNPEDMNQFNLFFVFHIQLLSLYRLIKYSFSRASLRFISPLSSGPDSWSFSKKRPLESIIWLN